MKTKMKNGMTVRLIPAGFRSETVIVEGTVENARPSGCFDVRYQHPDNKPGKTTVAKFNCRGQNKLLLGATVVNVG